jgi:hypothetical protein
MGTGRSLSSRLCCLSFKEPKNRFQGTNSARLGSLAGQSDNPIPARFLAPIDCLKITAQKYSWNQQGNDIGDGERGCATAIVPNAHTLAILNHIF